MTSKIKKFTSLEQPWCCSFSFEEDLENLHGFVYLIENLKNGKKYIGRKNFYSERKKTVPGKKRKVTVIKESDWKKYWSSCKPLWEDLHAYGIENFERTILACYYTQHELNYAEVEYQVKYKILTATLPNGEYEFYNDNILGRYYRRNYTNKCLK